MVLETLRMATAALSSPTYGVNQQIAGMTFSDGDSGPGSIATITDETVDAQLAQGNLPTDITLPAILLTLGNEPDLIPEVENNNRDSHIEVLITAVLKDANTETANTNTYYVLRAVQKALRQFNSNAHAADRAKNSVQVLQATAMTHAKLFKNPDDGMMTGSLRVTFLVRDINP